VKTLEELRREKRKLEAERDVHRDFERRERERRQLIQENRRLLHPGTFSFFKKAKEVGKGTVRIGVGIGKVVYKKIQENQRKPIRKKPIRKRR